MNPWDPVPYSVTPAAQVLARCVASGVLAQRDLDAVPRDTNVFSPRLIVAEQVADLKRQFDVKNLEMELLKLEKESADVTHSFFLSQRFAALQQFTSHLQEVLREQASLRQRLMKPLCLQNLPIEANLHRYVVELIGMVMDLIENMESKVKITRSFPSLGPTMTSLDNAVAQLLTQVAEVEELAGQVLQWKDLQHHMFTTNNQTST
ncbi:HAUS augmin-like complex subunit 2 [Anguilla rostrata]|uniref:HAUS augmin-like complex subunit 2 n=1 Tax=Anguilla anguilla TaxID=7936 RepID=A0A9D3N1K1_ANGAN|nr:HAUS augmin-like complex subunit 2 [Anguilla anguilla]XP_035242315.1 HAUS augmin-like complex subunit 2 [Anguilla anguilla]KAG5857170.1 hypothetical protein ANANG_G00016270 [Anguilla anguilla]